MSYEKSVDFKSIQADVLTTDVSDNDLISSLKQLKTDNKSITKAINALHEQLGNAQTSAADAVARVVELEQVNAQQAELITSLQTELAALKESAGKQEEVNNDTGEGNENGGSESGNGESGGNGGSGETQVTVPKYDSSHVMGMVLTKEGNNSGAGTWARVNQNFETIDFNESHGTWANMKTVTDTYGTFVEIPVTYVRSEVLTDGPYAGKSCWWTSDIPIDGFHVHPAFLGKDGKAHKLRVASYPASKLNDKPYSTDKGVTKTNYYHRGYDEIEAAVNTLGSKYKPYSIYDHHLLARLIFTEYGRTTFTTNLNYRGICYVHGTTNTGDNKNINQWIYGLMVVNDTYNILANDGSGQMIDTGIEAKNGYPKNCLFTVGDKYDLGDVFIHDNSNDTKISGSFASEQTFRSYGKTKAMNVYPNDGLFGAYTNEVPTPSGVLSVTIWRFCSLV